MKRAMKLAMKRARALPNVRWALVLLLSLPALGACGSGATNAADARGGDASAGADRTDAGETGAVGAPDGPVDRLRPPGLCPLPPGDGGVAVIPGPSPAEVTAQAPCTADGWCRENPFPADEAIGAAWGTAGNAVWFGGAEDEVLYWDGVRYHQIFAPRIRPSNGDVAAIWGSGPDDVWIGGQNGARHFDGFGWSDQDGPQIFDAVYAISGTGPADVWFGRQGGVIVHRTATGAVSTTLTPTGGLNEAVLGVWAVSTNDVWAVGTSSTIAHYDGSAWRPVMPDLPFDDERFIDVWGSGPSDVWIVGEHGVVLHWDGQGLRVEPIFTTSELHAIWGRGSDVWIVGTGGAIFRRVGGAWCNVWSGPRLHFDWIWGSGSDDVWAGTGLQIFHWDGQRWTERSRRLTADDLSGVEFTPDGTRWLTDSALWRWSDASVDLQAQFPGPGALRVFSATDAWAIGYDPVSFGALVPSHWDGQSVVAEPVPSGASSGSSAGSKLADIGGAASSDLWACGDGVLLRRTAGVWQNWTGTDLTGINLKHLWFRTATDAWAIGAGTSPIVRWNGARWTPMTADVVGAQEVFTIWGSGANDVWLLTDVGARHWDGTSFLPVPVASSGTGLSVIAGTGPTQAWMAGSGGGLSAWNGRQWSVAQSGTIKNLSGAGTSPAGDAYLVGNEGIILHRHPGP